MEMKPRMLLVLAFSHIVLVSTSVIRDPTAKDEKSDRIKRAAPDSTEAINCVSACLQNLTTALGNMGQASRIAGMTSFSKGVVAAQNKNDTYLDSMCSSYTGCRSCIDACPASTTASAVVKGLGELEYICVESLDAYKRQSACLAPVIQESEARCNDSCLQYFPALERLDDMAESTPNDAQDPSPDDMKSLLGSICMLAKCETTCIGQQVDVKCGV